MDRRHAPAPQARRTPAPDGRRHQRLTANSIPARQPPVCAASGMAAKLFCVAPQHHWTAPSLSLETEQNNQVCLPELTSAKRLTAAPSGGYFAQVRKDWLPSVMAFPSGHVLRDQARTGSPGSQLLANHEGRKLPQEPYIPAWKAGSR